MKTKLILIFLLSINSAYAQNYLSNQDQNLDTDFICTRDIEAIKRSKGLLIASLCQSILFYNDQAGNDARRIQRLKYKINRLRYQIKILKNK